jgi:alpha-tubulin suppressor-like RCC1 family protein
MKLTFWLLPSLAISTSLLAAPGDPLQASVVVTGGDHACAVLSDRHLKCWGGNARGQLGLGDANLRGDQPNEMGNRLPFVDLGTTAKVLKVSLGRDHSCATLIGGTLKCWGANGNGQLGLMHANDIGDDAGEMGSALAPVDVAPGLRVLEVAAGGYHTCARLEDGSVKCWGLNDFGQLGLGDTAQRGDDALEMGSNLPFVDLGFGHTAVQLAAGYNHTCALLDDGTVKCWGDNQYGQLGRGHVRNIGDDSFEMGGFLQTADLDYSHSVVRIDAGNDFTCALFDDSSVKCWGRNQYGQLGQGNILNRGDTANEMGTALPPVALGLALEPASSIVGGGFHTCALLGETVRCFGNNIVGQLGVGDRDYRGDDPGEMGIAIDIADLGTNLTPTQIDAGWIFSCARFAGGRVKCWGMGGYGQLGTGNIESLGQEPSELGDALPFIDLGTVPRGGSGGFPLPGG